MLPRRAPLTQLALSGVACLISRCREARRLVATACARDLHSVVNILLTTVISLSSCSQVCGRVCGEDPSPACCCNRAANPHSVRSERRSPA